MKTPKPMFKNCKKGDLVALMEGTHIVGFFPIVAVFSNMKDVITDICAGGFQFRADTGFSVVPDGKGDVKVDFFNRVIPMKGIPKSEPEIMKQCDEIEQKQRKDASHSELDPDQLRKQNSELLYAMKEACRIMNGDRTAPLARMLEARAVLVDAFCASASITAEGNKR